MPRRTTPANSRPEKKPNTVLDAKADVDRAEDIRPRTASPVLVVAIFGSFVLLSTLVLVLTLPGYLINWHTVKAEDAIADRRYPAAIDHLLYITKKFPKAWVRLTQLGDCYLELDQPQEALQAYERSLKFEPEQDLTAKLGRAQYLLGPAHQEEATRLLAGAIKSNPNDPYANFYIGLLHMQQKRYGEAAFFLQGATSEPRLADKIRPNLEEIREKLLGS